MIFPDRSIVERIRQCYPPGTPVRLVQMDDPQAPPPGTRGIVRGVDDTGSIMVSWETGGSLNVVYGIDRCEPVISPERREKILARALEYIVEAVDHNDLRATLHGCLGLSDDEIRALGIELESP